MPPLSTFQLSRFRVLGQSLDLKHAMEVLFQLKKATIKASRAKWILASWESIA